ncbi:ATP-binding protein, partial [Vibrio harveyi]|nr:ATP-binding protein [Vibrio harveyi]
MNIDIKRDFYLNKLISKMHNKRIKVITGIRRCGKSYLLFNTFYNYLKSNQVREEQIISISFENIKNKKYTNPITLYEYISSKIVDENTKYYILIDEIQMCEEIDNPYIENSSYKITFVDTLLSFYNKENIDVYVTGSNSKMLSTDVLTQFRDRADEIHISPLSYDEIITLYENKDQALKEYMMYGGLPYIYSLKTHEERSKYLKDLFKATYIKDIIERNKIMNDSHVLDSLLDFISSVIGSLTNPTRLTNMLVSNKKINISHSTVFKYLNYFEESFLISSCKRYDIKGQKAIDSPLKYYFSDIGLRNSRLNFRDEDKGFIQENIIYNELIKRGYEVNVGVVNYEYNENNIRKRSQLEVDFVVNIAHQRYYIQSALNIDSAEKREQEISSLKRINDSFKKIVIVYDEIIPRHDQNGILYIGLKQFLLEKDVLKL